MNASFIAAPHMVTAGAFLGDFVAQLVQHTLHARAKTVHQQKPRFTYNSQRSINMIAWAAFFATPVGVCWYTFLDQAIMPHAPTSPMAVLSKTALDQLFLTPILTSVFFAYMAWANGAPSRYAIPLFTTCCPCSWCKPMAHACDMHTCTALAS